MNLMYLLSLFVHAQLCVLCNPVDCSPPGYSVHGIFQTRILEWVSISCFRRSSGSYLHRLHQQADSLHWAIWEALVSLIFPFCLHIWLTSATGATLKRTWWRRVLWAAKVHCDGTAGVGWSGLLDDQRATWGAVGSLRGEGVGNWE